MDPKIDGSDTLTRVSSVTNVIKYDSWLMVLSQILNRLDKNLKPIEIELKYCLYQPNHYQQAGHNTIRELSHQSAIHFFKQQTNFKAGFYDQKRFYSIREYLLNICKANKSKLPAANFYAPLSDKFSNKKFRQIDSDLRIDFNLNDTRYTYTVREGWNKLKKKRAHDALDLIFCGTEFRFTFNEEEPQEISLSELKDVLLDKKPWVRIKNAMRFLKGEEIQIALSQVLTVNYQSQQFRDRLLELVDEPNEQMDTFIIGYFANFFNSKPHPDDLSRFQIESEILQPQLARLREELHSNPILVETFFQRMVQDLHSLYWADYSMMKEETETLRALFKSKNPNQTPPNPCCRFETLAGDYMRNEIRRFIQADRP